jgi:hypothetical protein
VKTAFAISCQANELYADWKVSLVTRSAGKFGRPFRGSFGGQPNAALTMAAEPIAAAPPIAQLKMISSELLKDD